MIFEILVSMALSQEVPVQEMSPGVIRYRHHLEVIRDTFFAECDPKESDQLTDDDCKFIAERVDMEDIQAVVDNMPPVIAAMDHLIKALGGTSIADTLKKEEVK